MKNEKYIVEKFGFLGLDFLQELENCALVNEIKPRTEIISPGERIQFIPVLLKGSIKVYTLNDGRELLYYYIKPGESCIMTFASIFQNRRSRVYAYAEESSKVALIPVANLVDFLKKHPEIYKVFYQEYDIKFTTLMDTVNDVIFNKLDTRVFNYINQRMQFNEENPVKMSHKEIAAGLGTAREVVSRVLKKLANEGCIIQHKQYIEIIHNKIVTLK